MKRANLFMKIVIAACGLLTNVSIFGAADASPTARPKYTIFAGSPKNTYTRFGEDIQKACPTLDIQIITTFGSFDNINQLVQQPVLRTGYRFAFVQNDALRFIQRDREVANALRVVAPLYREDIYLLVNKQSRIRSISDLKGKRISIGVQGAGLWYTSQRIGTLLNAQWLPVERPTEESIIAVLSGSIDGAVIVGGTPIAIFSEMGKFTQQYTELIPLEDKRLDTEYPSTIVSAGTYPWLDTHTILRTVQSSIIAASDVPKPAVDQLISCLKTNQKALRRWGHPKWAEVSFSK